MSQQISRRQFLILSGAAFGAAMAGCAPVTPAAQPQAPAAQPTTAAAAAAGKKSKVTFWQGNLRPADVEGITKLQNRFAELYPNIELERVDVGFTDQRSKLLAAVETHTLPSAGRMAWPHEFARLGALRPLDDLVTQDLKDRLLGWEYCNIPGPDGKVHLYGVPKFINTYTLFYNKTFFDKEGIKAPPKTWDEVQGYAKQLTKASETRWGIAIPMVGNETAVNFMRTIVSGFGGDVIGTFPYQKSTGPEKITWNSPATVTGVDYVNALFRQGYVTPGMTEGNAYSVGSEALMAGKAAMYLGQTMDTVTLQTGLQKQGWELANAPIPAGPVRKLDLYYPGVLCITRDAEDVDAAWTFLKFYTSDEGLALYMKTNGMLPSSKALEKDDFWQKNPLFKNFADEAAAPTTSLMNPTWLDSAGISGIYQNSWTPVFQKMLLGNIAPAEAVKQTHDLLVKALADLGITGV